MESIPGTHPATPGPGRHRFGDVVVDTAARTVWRDGQQQALEPKAFSVLAELLARRGELVTREQLLDAVWGHRHVTPGVLTRAVAQVRAALDDDCHAPRFIQTRHALGYVFIAVPGEPPPSAAPSDAHVPVPDPVPGPGPAPGTAQIAVPVAAPVAALDSVAPASGGSAPAAASPAPEPRDRRTHARDRRRTRRRRGLLIGVGTAVLLALWALGSDSPAPPGGPAPPVHGP